MVKFESEAWETILGLLNSIQPIKIEPPRLRSSSPAALAGQVCLSRVDSLRMQLSSLAL